MWFQVFLYQEIFLYNCTIQTNLMKMDLFQLCTEFELIITNYINIILKYTCVYITFLSLMRSSLPN